MMRYGLKLWSQNPSHFFDEAIELKKKKLIDFLELYVVPHSFNELQFEKLKQIPITIHATHELHGLNLAQENEKNREILSEVFHFANFLNAKKIILHPGSNGSIHTTLEHLKTIKDPRILIENMPYRVIPEFGPDICIGSSTQEMRQMLALGFEMCLDIGHAVAASVAQHIPYKDHIEQFLTFSPFYFHLSDGRANQDYDEHMNLGKGEIDYRWIKAQIEKTPSPWIVFETPKEGNNLDNDVNNMEYFRRL